MIHLDGRRAPCTTRSSLAVIKRSAVNATEWMIHLDGRRAPCTTRSSLAVIKRRTLDSRGPQKKLEGPWDKARNAGRMQTVNQAGATSWEGFEGHAIASGTMSGKGSRDARF